MIYQIPHNDLEKEIIYNLKTTNRTNLSLASNFAYELWINSKFVGSGGHRCTDTEIYIDTWSHISETDQITVRYQWFNFNKISVWHRRIFPIAIFADFADMNGGNWELTLDNSIKFGDKICAQLPHQNIISNSKNIKKLSLEIMNQCASVFKPLPIKPMTYVNVTPKLISKSNIPIHANFKTLASILWSNKSNFRCETYDLGYIALHRFEVDTTNHGVILYYSEVNSFSAATLTSNRSKVKLADAIEPNVKSIKSGSPFGTRGCRYVHVIYPDKNSSLMKVYRCQYPFDWVDRPIKSGCEKIVLACKNNLIACVDGGVVDTCWRERAQWVGDARISLMALKYLTSNTEIIEFVLDQIAQSYDPQTGLVQGAYPIKTNKYNCQIPTYHLFYCYAVIEFYGKKINDQIKAWDVVMKSLNFWSQKYVKDGILSGMPGWYFLDWDKSDEMVSDRLYKFRNNPHSVCNAMFYDLCKILGINSGIDIVKFNKLFCWNSHAYSINANGFANVHATALILSLESFAGAAGKSYLIETIESSFDMIRDRVTAYYAFFIAKALKQHCPEKMMPFIKKYYGPIAESYGTIYEKTNGNASLAHGWSIGIASLIIKNF